MRVKRGTCPILIERSDGCDRRMRSQKERTGERGSGHTMFAVLVYEDIYRVEDVELDMLQV
jgi:hypothetical protein